MALKYKAISKWQTQTRTKPMQKSKAKTKGKRKPTPSSVVTIQLSPHCLLLLTISHAIRLTNQNRSSLSHMALAHEYTRYANVGSTYMHTSGATTPALLATMRSAPRTTSRQSGSVSTVMYLGVGAVLPPPPLAVAVAVAAGGTFRTSYTGGSVSTFMRSAMARMVVPVPSTRCKR